MEKNRTDEMVFLRMPAWAWDVLGETLAMDADSASFEYSLRSEIAEALDNVVDVTWEVTHGKDQTTAHRNRSG